MPDPAQTVDTIERVIENSIPGAQILAPFHPLIALVTTAVIAHFNATKSWPTEAQVRASLPVDYQQLQDTWTAWKPSGDGSLPTK